MYPNENQILLLSEEKITVMMQESIGCPRSGVTWLTPKMGTLVYNYNKVIIKEKKKQVISNQ